MKFEIEKGVPIPERKTPPGRGQMYPFSELQPGDSFFVPGDKKMNSTISSAQKRTGHRYRYLRTDEGTRIWRVDGMEPTPPEPTPTRKTRALKAIRG